MNTKEQAKLAREASIKLATLPAETKNKALLEMAKSVMKNSIPSNRPRNFLPLRGRFLPAALASRQENRRNPSFVLSAR